MYVDPYVQDYKILGSLGYGAQAEVYLGEKDSQLYAIKVFKKINQQVFNAESQFLKQIQSNNIVKFIESKFEASVHLQCQKQKIRPMVVMQFIDHGDIFDYIGRCGPLPPEIARAYFLDILSAIQYLQSINIAHRDIKLQNLLLDKYFSLKLTDFGLSTANDGKQKDGILKTRIGTQGYRPPEMEQNNPCYSGLQSDIFASGVCLFIMMTQLYPFQRATKANKRYNLIINEKFQLFWNHQKQRKPNINFPPLFQDLMNSMFNAKKQKRMNIQQIKNHAWLQLPTATKQQIQQQMQNRYQRLKQLDKQKQKIDSIKAKKMKIQIQQDNRSQMSEDRALSQEFLTVYHQYKGIIDQCDLPSCFKHHKAIRINANPAFLMAWLTQVLRNCQTNNMVFIEDSQQITAYKYKLIPNQDQKNFSIELQIQIQDEFQEIQLKGNLYKSNKQQQLELVWSKQRGNQFWARSAIQYFNQQLLGLKSQ